METWPGIGISGCSFETRKKDHKENKPAFINFVRNGKHDPAKQWPRGWHPEHSKGLAADS
jgi:hypothetical protein